MQVKNLRDICACFYNILGGSEAHLKAFVDNEAALETVLSFIRRFHCIELHFEAYDILHLLF
jgi:hypothetical protein